MKIKSTYDISKAQKFDIAQWHNDKPIFQVLGYLLESGYVISLDSYFLRFPIDSNMDKWVKVIHYHGTPKDNRLKYIPQYPKSYVLSFEDD